MNGALESEIESLGGDPTDQAWYWFVCRGPHGPKFTWGRQYGSFNIDLLERTVVEKSENDPTFRSRLEDVVDRAFASADPNFLCRALQVGSVLGGQERLDHMIALQLHPDPLVASNARAAAFYLKHQVRQGKKEL